MKPILSLPVILCIVLLAGCSSDDTDILCPTGEWAGALGGADIRASISGDSTFTGDFHLADYDDDMTAPVRMRGDSMLISLPTEQFGSIVLVGLYTDSLVSGTFFLDGSERPFYLRRIQPLSDAAMQEVVGWYANKTNDSLLFTYGPYDDAYFFDFNGLAAGGRYPVDDSTIVRFDDTGQVDVTVRIRHTSGSTILFDVTNGMPWTKLAEQPYTQQEVAFRSEDVMLSGVLYCPTDVTDAPGIVYIHGSGFNNTRVDFHDMYMLNYLAQRGIAVLMPDKRGCGASGGDWRTVSFEVLARDALAAAGTLADCETVDPQRIGIFGFSQGGWIAPLAASMSDDIAFVVNGSGAAVTLSEQIAHEMHNTYVNAGIEGELLAQFDSLQMMAHRFAQDTTKWGDYLSLRSRLMETEARQMAAGFPPSIDNWRWEWARKVGDFDPMPLYKKLDIPVLVVYGAEDETDNVPVKESIKRLQRTGDNVTIRRYEGSGHALGDPTGVGYVRTDALDAIAEFVKGR